MILSNTHFIKKFLVLKYTLIFYKFLTLILLYLQDNLFHS